MLKREDIHIIAEAGTNNNGRLDKAKNLCDIAKRANADSVKFQMINTWGLYLPGDYEYGKYDIKDVIRIREEGQMTDEEYTALNAHCNTENISFTSSVFDEKSLDLLASFKPKYVKIASSDLNNVSFLRKVASRGIKMVISTGMSTLQDVQFTMNELAKVNFSDIVLLHCVSVYPAQLRQANLPFIKTLKDEFGTEVGFSDHTGNSMASCMALNYGATWFEKHFTEDKSQEGLDHAYALDEQELTAYVSDIEQAIEAINGNDIKISEAEFYTRRRARRSMYASKDLKQGDVITEQDVLVVRPENVMQANEYDLVIGATLTTDLKQHGAFNKDILKR